jgi:hypothetical protein
MKDYSHNANFMLDLETFGKNPDAAFVTLAIVQFPINLDLIDMIEKEDFSAMRAMTLNIRPHKDATYDFDTIRWWLKQSQGARDSVSQKKGIPENVALERLERFISADAKGEPIPKKKRIIWSRGIDFDLPILKSAYLRAGMSSDDMPWNFWNSRDQRTIVNLGARVSRKKLTWMNAHDALHDCYAQIYEVIKVRKMKGLQYD